MDAFDEILARLRFDRGQWETTIHVPCWPEPIDLQIVAAESGPSPYQKRVLAAIVDHPRDLKSLVEDPIFRYCLDFAGETFETIDDECNFVPFEFPTLSKPSEIWNLIELPAIRIEEGIERDYVEFDLTFYCPWDLEHCLLRVPFRDFEVVAVE